MGEEMMVKWITYECSVCGARIIEAPNISRICGFISDKKSCKGKYYPVGFLESEIPKETLDFLKDPNLFNKYIQETDKRIVGEYQNKENIVLAIHGARLVINAEPTSSNTFVQGTSGSGKDNLVKESVLNLMGKGLVHHLTRISPRVLDYYHNQEAEPYFTWNGMILYLEDVSQKILNGETLRVMCSGGNHVVIIKDGVPVELVIDGKPCIIATSSQSYLDEDMRRRWGSFSPDISEEHTKKIKKFKGLIAKRGNLNYDKHIINASYCLRRVNVSIPFAEQLTEKFPDSLLARTGISRLLDFIKFSTALHQYQRQQNDKGEFIATIKDYEIARKVFMNIYGERKTLEPLSSNQKAILDYLEGVKVQCSASDVHNKVGKNCFNQFTGTYKALNSLVRKGLINSDQEGDMTYYSSKKQEEFLLIEPNALMGSEGNEGSKGNQGSEGSKILLPQVPSFPIKFDHQEVQE